MSKYSVVYYSILYYIIVYYTILSCSVVYYDKMSYGALCDLYSNLVAFPQQLLPDAFRGIVPVCSHVHDVIARPQGGLSLATL